MTGLLEFGQRLVRRKGAGLSLTARRSMEFRKEREHFCTTLHYGLHYICQNVVHGDPGFF